MSFYGTTTTFIRTVTNVVQKWLLVLDVGNENVLITLFIYPSFLRTNMNGHFTHTPPGLVRSRKLSWVERS